MPEPRERPGAGMAGTVAAGARMRPPFRREPFPPPTGKIGPCPSLPREPTPPGEVPRMIDPSSSGAGTPHLGGAGRPLLAAIPPPLRPTPRAR